MPTVYHPNAVRDTVDDVDDAVSLGGDTIQVHEDNTLDVTAAQAKTLARLYDIELEEITVDADASEDPEPAEDVEDNTPTCAGKDGNCGRDVDEPGDYCWQHGKEGDN